MEYDVYSYVGPTISVGKNMKIDIDTYDMVVAIRTDPYVLKINSMSVQVTHEQYKHVINRSDYIGKMTIAKYNVALQEYLPKKHKDACLADKYSMEGIFARSVKIK